MEIIAAVAAGAGLAVLVLTLGTPRRSSPLPTDATTVTGRRVSSRRRSTVTSPTARRTTSAANHAPDAPVSLFAEIDERQVSAYVRDRGPGFDLETIPQDRRGVRDPIIARMVRHGGHAAVRTAPAGAAR